MLLVTLLLSASPSYAAWDGWICSDGMRYVLSAQRQVYDAGVRLGRTTSDDYGHDDEAREHLALASRALGSAYSNAAAAADLDSASRADRAIGYLGTAESELWLAGLFAASSYGLTDDPDADAAVTAIEKALLRVDWAVRSLEECGG